MEETLKSSNLNTVAKDKNSFDAAHLNYKNLTVQAEDVFYSAADRHKP